VVDLTPPMVPNAQLLALRHEDDVTISCFACEQPLLRVPAGSPASIREVNQMLLDVGAVISTQAEIRRIKGGEEPPPWFAADADPDAPLLVEVTPDEEHHWYHAACAWNVH